MEERHKIQVFQRELPFWLELVTQLPKPKRCKQQISDAIVNYLHGQSECSEQTSSEGHVFEEFIPLTRISYNSKCTTQRGVGQYHEEQVKGYSDGDDEKWGAFQPFQREKSIGKTNRPVAKEPSSALATSSTTDTVSGDSGGKQERRERWTRKQRRSWSPELHRRFLHALLFNNLVVHMACSWD